MYALITDDFEIKRAKGVNNNHVKNKLTFKDYLEALYRTSDVSIKTITSYGFRSYNHEIVTEKNIKAGLNNFDDKRYIVDGIHTTALGHYRI